MTAIEAFNIRHKDMVIITPVDLVVKADLNYHYCLNFIEQAELLYSSDESGNFNKVILQNRRDELNNKRQGALLALPLMKELQKNDCEEYKKQVKFSNLKIEKLALDKDWTDQFLYYFVHELEPVILANIAMFFTNLERVTGYKPDDFKVPLELYYRFIENTHYE